MGRFVTTEQLGMFVGPSTPTWEITYSQPALPMPVACKVPMTARIDCSGQRHRVVIAPDGTVSTPDHGPEIAALAAIGNTKEDTACIRVAQALGNRVCGFEKDNHWWAVPSRLKASGVRASNWLASRWLRRIRLPGEPQSVWLRTWKLSRTGNATVHGQQYVDNVFAPGEIAYEACQRATDAARGAALSSQCLMGVVATMRRSAAGPPDVVVLGLGDPDGRVALLHSWLGDGFNKGQAFGPSTYERRAWDLIKLARRHDANIPCNGDSADE